MTSYDNMATPMANYIASMPQQCVGKLFARIKHPLLPISTWHRVEVWGQVCDGGDHRMAVHLMLHNRWSNRGRGYTYVEWRAEPDLPDENSYPRTGKVSDPKPYSGVAYE